MSTTDHSDPCGNGNCRDFFGRPIFLTDKDFTITDQVYEVLSEEIRAGHWQVGERLPSVAALSRDTGVGRAPIQQAFERLEQEGYLRIEQRSGTYLQARFPKGDKSLGTLGVALHLDEDKGHRMPEAYSHFRLAQLLKIASRRGYETDVQYLHSDAEWQQVDAVDGVFGRHVRGVVTLHAFDREDSLVIPPGKLPLVYLGSNSRRCQPVVAGDTSKGFYDATKQLIRLGHTKIICFMDPSEAAFENGIRLGAHEAAMTEERLAPNGEAAEKSYTIQSGDLLALKDWLAAFADATAIICMRGSESRHLVEVARLVGRRVPEDLSLIGHGQIPQTTDLPITSLDYDYERLFEASLDLLSEQIRTRKASVSRVLLRPYFHEGLSVGTCPGAQARPLQLT